MIDSNHKTPRLKRNMNTLVLLFFIPAFVVHATTSTSIGGREENVDFFSCISAQGITNFTTPNNEEYYRIFDLAASNLRVINASTIPNAIVVVETKEQLAATIICCRRTSWEFTFRSGGQSLEGNSYSLHSHPYVMIDMMKLNKVVVDLATKTAWIEGGATLGEVYYAVGTSSDTLAFPAGFYPPIGSGGQIAGGGLGPISRMHGLSSDCVVDAILINAGGQFLDRKSMGEDVFWALRGGGAGSWGVVYSWKIKLVDVPKNITAFQVTRKGSLSDAVKLLDRWQRVAPYLEDKFGIIASVIATSKTSVTIVAQGLFLGPKSEAVSSCTRSFPELRLLSDEVKEMKYIESILFFNSGSGRYNTIHDLNNRFASSDMRSYLKWKGDYIKECIPIEGLKGMVNLLAKEPHGQLQAIPLGGIMWRIKSDATPFPHRRGNLFSIGYFASWAKNESDKSGAYLDWVESMYEYMTPYAPKGPRTAYVNQLDFDFGVMDWDNPNITPNEQVEIGRVLWGEKYFLSNYDRLVRVKTAIDPSNVFRHQQSIPPKELVEGLGTDDGNLYSSY